MRMRAELWMLLALLTALGGCRSFSKSCHEPQQYQRATTTPPLVIPAGIDPIDTTNALKLPTLKEPAPPPHSSKAPCLDEPPPFKVKDSAKAPQA